MALSDIGSNAVELLGLAGVLGLLGFRWLPERFEQRSAARFVTACTILPLLSFLLRAVTIWRQAKRAAAREQEPLGGWRPEDLKWLDSPREASDAATDDDTEVDDMHARHLELQRLLRQRMEDARERVCLDAIGEAIARLEAAKKCRMELCCATDPSASFLHSFLVSAKAAFYSLVPGSDTTASSCTSPNGRQGRIACSARPLSWASCFGTAVTEIAPRVEFLALGIFLAVFGGPCRIALPSPLKVPIAPQLHDQAVVLESSSNDTLRSMLHLLRESVIAAGLSCFSVAETNDNYWLLHSLWHLTIQSAACLILMARLHHPTLSEMKGCQPPSTPAREQEAVALPSRSLSEAIAAATEPQPPSTSEGGAQLHLAGVFWRVLQQKQSRLAALDLQGQATFGDPPGQPQQEQLLQGDQSPSLPSESYSSVITGNATRSSLQQLQPSFVWLLLRQYQAHKKAHGRLATQQQQLSGGEGRSLPSPTGGEEGVVRVGTAAALRDPALPLSHASGSSSQTNSTVSDIHEWDCLWCAATESLDGVALLRVHMQRLWWTCRLRLAPTISCCLMPSWLESPVETRMQELQSDPRDPRASVFLCI